MGRRRGGGTRLAERQRGRCARGGTAAALRARGGGAVGGGEFVRGLGRPLRRTLHRHAAILGDPRAARHARRHDGRPKRAQVRRAAAVHRTVGAAAAGAARAHARRRGGGAAWPLPEPRTARPPWARADRPLVQAARGRAVERVGARAGVEGRVRAVAARRCPVAAGGDLSKARLSAWVAEQDLPLPMAPASLAVRALCGVRAGRMCSRRRAAAAASPRGRNQARRSRRSRAA
jgi:hypothetical protein